MVLLHGAVISARPARLEALTADLLQNMALQATDLVDLHGLDSACWRRLCSSF